MVKRQDRRVKTTTVEGVVRAIFGDSSLLCRGCGARGGYLCECCKKYILRRFKAREVVYFEDPVSSEEEEAARELSKVFSRAEFLGFRDELLGEMVEEYKYQAIRGMGRAIGELGFLMYFKERVKEGEVILVPMATSRKHIRERGFDHMMVVAKEIERRAGGRVKVMRLIERARDTVQVGASDKVRQEQAKEAVRANPEYFEKDFQGGSGEKSGRFPREIREAKVVLLDDVWTTGASMIEAGRKLREAGVEELGGLTFVRNRRGASPVIRGGEVAELVEGS